MVAVPPSSVLAVRHAADKDSTGKAAGQVTNMQRGESGLKGTAPGRAWAWGHKSVRFA